MNSIQAFRWVLVSVILLTVLRAAPAYPAPPGPIFSLAVDPVTPTTLYAGAASGVWKSADGGATWNVTGLTDREHYSLAIDPFTPTTLYAGRNGAIAKSTDGGASWSAVAVVGDVFDLLIDPATPTTVYATVSAVGGRSILKSTNGGASWTPIGPPVNNVYVVAMDPVTPTTIYAAGFDSGVTTNTCCTIFKSTDGGTSWVEGGNVAANYSLAVDPVTPTTLYAASDFGVFKSTDGGTSWVAAGPTVYTLAIDPLTPATLYGALTNLTCSEIDSFECTVQTGLIYKSMDRAATWTEVAELDDHAVSILAIDPLTPTTLYAAGSDVLKSTDGGNTWSATVTRRLRSQRIQLRLRPRSTRQPTPPEPSWPTGRPRSPGH